ncbi:glycosyltransferase family 39 protein [Methanoplanus endosymbiosus]|uniref:Glycosyltransferase family 39 protein n=1 Tax=Methanoplanus endosymbiosus TaxID=33865 RepID=A0A9E7PJW7_9EURY|nr:glycosyltransferase family 39 protein [Methanoplanus endosymbiosus]UUX91328.1 glycosyltransferase family 39 protein [Methanoplanus endosymbiosus]
MGKKSGRKKKGEEVKNDNTVFIEEKYSINSYRDLNAKNIINGIRYNRFVQILTGLIIIGIILRLYNLSFNSLWLDEATTLNYARRSLFEIFESSIISEFHPPLFYWIEHLMLNFGETEFILRFWPAVFGILAIPIFYLIGCEIKNREVGIISALLITISPFAIFYSQDARSYTMTLFFFSLSLLCYLYALKEKNVKWWIIFGLTSALALWSHYYVIIGTGILMIHAIITNYKEFRNNKSSCKIFLIGLLSFLIISLPLIFVLYQRYLALSEKAPTSGILGISLISASFEYFSGYNWYIAVMFILLFLIGTLYLMRENLSYSILILGLIIVPLIFSVIISAKIPTNPRYLIYLLPVFYIGIGLSYVPLKNIIKNNKFIYVFMAFLILINIPFMATYYTGYSKNDWKGFSENLNGITENGDIIVVIPGYMVQPLNYYYSNSSDRTIELLASSHETLMDINKKYPEKTKYYIMTGDIMAADPSGGTLKWLQDNGNVLGQHMGIYLLKSNP